MTIEKKIQNICLSIAGLDPSGGAGIIADLKTFAAFDCYGAAVVTSVTFQNTQGVFGAEHQRAESVRKQILPIFDDFEVSAIKTGMLPTREIIEEVAVIAVDGKFENFVVDPVVRSTSGFDLIDDTALKALIEKLFPLSTVITPNLAEAERIADMKIENYADIKTAARVMRDAGARAVIIKGGHLPISDLGFGIADLEYSNGPSEFTVEVQNSQGPRTKDKGREAIDFMFIDGEEFRFSADFIETTATHGTGCTFAAAITAGLANGQTLREAVAAAKRFVTEAIRTSPRIGKGHSPVNHLIKKW